MTNVYKQWSIVELTYQCKGHSQWDQPPFQTAFRHEAGAVTLLLEPFWDGEETWRIRFAPTLPGTWSWQVVGPAATDSTPESGELYCEAANEAELTANPNLRGHLRVAESGRYFEYADGTDFFWLGDTNWNVMGKACSRSGPFYEWMNDRLAKRFNLVQIQFFSPNTKNDGGFPFPSYLDEADNFDRLNPAYFQEADQRMQALWEHGLAIAAHPSWVGKQLPISCASALRYSRYLLSRYGAYNLLWSLAGEYQYSYPTGERNPLPWRTEEWNQLGQFVQQHNVYKHPVTIHPSSRHAYHSPASWPRASHGQSSSGEFHSQAWLDFNWTQTGHQESMLWFVPYRQEQNYARAPVKPVLHSEGWYEGHGRIERVGDAYDVRWQAWVSTLAGSCGHTYGAEGVWSFHEPDDPDSIIPYEAFDPISWKQGIRQPGSEYFRHYRAFFEALAWWTLTPHRDWVRIDGRVPDLQRLTDPHCAALPDELYVVYIPRGNHDSQLHLLHLGPDKYQAIWYNPRSGGRQPAGETGEAFDEKGEGIWTVPAVPDQEDWVLLLQARGEI